jgi:tetratricopeptide (TPR) repeat protein
VGEARNQLDKAVKQAPTDPEVYVALARYLAAQQRPAREMDELLETIRTQIKPEQRALTLGRCLEELGRPADAGKEYERALKEQPRNTVVIRLAASFLVRTGQGRAAEGLLRQITEHQVEASSEELAWARRALALLLSGANDLKSFREALALVGLSLGPDGKLPRDIKPDENTETERTRARVLAAQPQRHFRERAVEMLEGLAVNGALSQDDAYVLALLYDSTGQWPKARERLLELVSDLYMRRSARPQAAQYIAQYVQGLIRNKELGEAQLWLDRLDRLNKQSEQPGVGQAVVELKARMLEAQDQRDKALDLLREFARRPGAAPQDITLVLTALARQQRFAEAFDLWPKAAESLPPESAGGLSVALLRSMSPTDEQVKRVEDWLKAAIRQHPDKVVLRMHLADMYDLRGRYDEALTEYRTVLDKEPNNVVALNNLAWLLAHRSGEEAKALPLIETAVQGQGRRADLLDTRGVVLLKLGRTDAALADLKEAVADVRTPSRLFHLARAHQQAKDRDTALKVLREAKESGLKPSDLHPVEQQACRQMLAEFGLQ